MTHFRKRLDASIINQVNKWIIEVQMQEREETQTTLEDDHYVNAAPFPRGKITDETSTSQQEGHPEKPFNQGSLLNVATCALEKNPTFSLNSRNKSCLVFDERASPLFDNLIR